MSADSAWCRVAGVTAAAQGRAAASCWANLSGSRVALVTVGKVAHVVRQKTPVEGTPRVSNGLMYLKKRGPHCWGHSWNHLAGDVRIGPPSETPRRPGWGRRSATWRSLFFALFAAKPHHADIDLSVLNGRPPLGFDGVERKAPFFCFFGRWGTLVIGRFPALSKSIGNAGGITAPAASSDRRKLPSGEAGTLAGHGFGSSRSPKLVGRAAEHTVQGL